MVSNVTLTLTLALTLTLPPPLTVVEALPHGGGVRGVNGGRWDREGPVVVEPPEGQPRLPAEGAA